MEIKHLYLSLEGKKKKKSTQKAYKQINNSKKSKNKINK